MLAVVVFGAALGFVLAAWDGVTSGSAPRAWRDGGLGALAGGVAGLIGGLLADVLFEAVLREVSLSTSQTSIENRLRVARVLAWAVFGGFAGLGLGVRGGRKKMINGLIGGAVGGAMGGLIFQQVDFMIDGSGFTVRLLGYLATGTGIGLAIGVVERALRESWLSIIGGPMTGKEFSLAQPVTTIGSDYRADIVLGKDPGIEPTHVALVRADSGVVQVERRGTQPVFVNQQQVDAQRLRAGDQLQVGGTMISFQQRRTAG